MGEAGLRNLDEKVFKSRCGGWKKGCWGNGAGEVNEGGQTFKIKNPSSHHKIISLKKFWRITSLEYSKA